MSIGSTEVAAFQMVLGEKEAELTHAMRARGGITIEKSADQMDEIQYASERDLAILSVDRDSGLLRQVRAALARIADGEFGTCADCESSIGTKRLAALPWAQRCIRCQEAADQSHQDDAELADGTAA
jgi:DnaK suppressor protein